MFYGRDNCEVTPKTLVAVFLWYTTSINYKHFPYSMLEKIQNFKQLQLFFSYSLLINDYQ